MEESKTLGEKEAGLFLELVEEVDFIRRQNIQCGNVRDSVIGPAMMMNTNQIEDFIGDLAVLASRIKDRVCKKIGKKNLLDTSHTDNEFIWKELSKRVLEGVKMFSELMADIKIFCGLPEETRFYWQWRMVTNYFLVDEDKCRMEILVSLVSQGSALFDLRTSSVWEDFLMPPDEKVEEQSYGPGNILGIISTVSNVIGEPRKSEEKPVYTGVLLVGDSNVGKSSVLHRHLYNEFKSLDKTIGIVSLNGLKGSKFKYYDAGGSKEYSSMTMSYLSRAKIVIVVFDVTSKTSFISAEKYIQSLQVSSHAPERIVLVGNKIDLNGRAVSSHDACKLCSEYDLEYVETSSKSGRGVEHLFHLISYPRIKLEDKAHNTHKEVFSRIERAQHSVHLGYIEKRGFYSTALKTRWVVLSASGVLQYFVNSNDEKPRGSIELKNYSVTRLKLSNPTDEDFRCQERCFTISDWKRTYRFRTETESSCDHWIFILQHSDLLFKPKLTAVQ